MTASASRCWGACAEPMVSRQPRGPRASSRTMAPVRTCAPEAAARAGGRVPRPPARVVNTAGRAGRLPARVSWPAGRAAAGAAASEAAAAASEACVRDAWARPGSVASNDSSSDRPAYTPPSSGSTSRSTTSGPNRAAT